MSDRLAAASNLTLSPVFSAHDRAEFERGLQTPAFVAIGEFGDRLIESANAESYTVDGFCALCDKTVPFLVDMKAGGQRIENQWIPNWRERLVCPFCGMNNRQRLIATLVKQDIDRYRGMNIYFMEQVTPIYRWAKQTFPQHQITGSEYLGYEFESGDVINGVRHEDVIHMSFPDQSLDMIISNDVFEHVPDPEKAFQECVRVLRPGGIMLATIPFFNTYDVSATRADVTESTVRHLLPPVFHGNPVSENGSLVFTDFGWRIFQSFRLAGFSDAVMQVYASRHHGHLGTGLSVFRLAKGGTRRSLDKRRPPLPRLLRRLRKFLSDGGATAG